MRVAIETYSQFNCFLRKGRESIPSPLSILSTRPETDIPFSYPLPPPPSSEALLCKGSSGYRIPITSHSSWLWFWQSFDQGRHKRFALRISHEIQSLPANALPLSGFGSSSATGGNTPGIASENHPVIFDVIQSQASTSCSACLHAPNKISSPVPAS
jgi:hypothetical protein